MVLNPRFERLEVIEKVGCGGLQCTEAARPAIPLQIASQASYPYDSAASEYDRRI